MIIVGIMITIVSNDCDNNGDDNRLILVSVVQRGSGHVPQGHMPPYPDPMENLLKSFHAIVSKTWCGGWVFETKEGDSNYPYALIQNGIG